MFADVSLTGLKSDDSGAKQTDRQIDARCTRRG